MSKKLFFLFLLVLTFQLGKAQYFNWNKGFGGVQSDEGKAIDIDSSGNVYVTGTFIVTADFDPGPGVFNLTSVGAEDIFLAKFDSLGNFKWARSWGGTFPDESFSVETDPSGDVIICGYFQNTMDFDPGVGTDSYTSLGDEDVFIIKLDSLGNYDWGIRYGTANEDVAKDICVDSLGNIMVAGEFSGTIDFGPGPSRAPTLVSSGSQDIFIVSIDSTGNPFTALKFGGTYGETVQAMSVGPGGFRYLTGTFSATANFNPGGTTTMSPTGMVDIYVVKLQPFIGLVWAKRFGVASYQAAGYGISADPAGDVVFTGYFQNTVDFDPNGGVFNLTAVGTRDAFVCKLRGNGTLSWAKRIGGTSVEDGKCVMHDKSSNVYTVGSFWNTVDFDPNAGVQNLTADGSSDGFIQKLDSAGNYQWAYKVGGNWYEEILGLAFTKYDRPLFTGFFSDTTDVDPGPGVFNLIPTTYQYPDVLISSVGFNCAMPYPGGPISGPTSACQWTEAAFTVAPSYGATYYTWSFPPGSGIMSGAGTNSITVVFGPNSGTISYYPDNSCGLATGDSLAITVDILPTISTQPSNQSTDEQTSATFSCVAIGSSLTYQWQKKIGSSFINITNASPYSGVFTNTLTINPVPLSYDDDYYRCMITNGVCVDSTLQAMLNVVDTITVIDNIQSLISSGLSVFPTVTDAEVTIDNKTELNDVTWVVTEISGRKLNSGILTKGLNSIPLNDYSAGIYFLTMGNGEFRKVQKLIRK